MTDDPEALRRRLYRPGATAADVDAYAAARPEPVEDPPQGERAPEPRRPRRPTLLAGTGAAVVALAVGVALLPGQEPTAPRPTAAAVVDVQRAALVADTTEAERNGFVRALVAAQPAGISAWLDRRVRTLRGPLPHATRSDTVESGGSGRRTLTLEPPSVGDGGGHVTVLVVVARTASVRWDLRRGGAIVDTRSLTAIGGDLEYGTIDYAAGARPGRLTITAPDGVRWGAAAVFSD